MKKQIILALIAISLTIPSQAQFFRYGIKGGVSSSSIKIDKTTIDLQEAQQVIIEQGDAKLGLHFGMFTRIKVLNVFIQPEFLFTQTNGEFIITEQNPNDPSSITRNLASQSFNKFDIPIMAGMKFGPAKVFLGPVATFTISEKLTLPSNLNFISSDNVKNEVNKAVFGFQAGVGLDIFKFATLDFKYEGNLSRLGDGIVIAGSERKFDQRNPQWIISLGIYL